MTSLKKETAEQKLLKMIEASGGATVQSAQAQKKVVKKQGLVSVIKAVNQILFFGVIVSVLFLANQIFAGIRLLSQNTHFDVDRKANQNSGTDVNLIPSTQKLSFYMASVKERNVFQPFEASSAQSVNVEVSQSNARISRKTSNLKLVGISWLDSVDSASAIIEDAESKVTYFLQKGEKVGDVVVKTIYADSVELGYEDEEIIIKYDKTQM